MYELSVEADFCASHAIRMDGRREAAHEHRWRVRVVVAGAGLDADGLLCDFQAIQSVVDEVLAPLRGTMLNRTPPFAGINPTAEHLARHLAREVASRLAPAIAGRAALTAVRVTEEPGCTATYRPGGGA